MAKKGRSRSSRGDGDDAALITYRGPLKLGVQNNVRTTRTNIVIVGAPAGNATTGMYMDYGTSVVTSAAEWASFAAVYDEARVLAMQVHYEPYYNNTYAVGGPTANCGAVAVYHDATPRVSGGVTTFGSVDEICANPSWRVWHTGKSVSIGWRATGTEEMQFATIAAGLPRHGGISGWIPGASSTSVYGRIYVSILVEFRGRQ